MPEAGGFNVRRVSAEGFEIRYLEAGEGPPLVCLHGAGGLRMTDAHDLLARRRRVIAFELPGFGASAVNERTASLPELAQTMLAAVTALGIDRFAVWGTSFGARLALWLAVAAPERPAALVLAAPAAILAGRRPPEDPAAMAEILYARPERRRPSPPPDPAVVAKQQALFGRLMDADDEAGLHAAMRSVQIPALVLFGSEDRLTPPALGRRYAELLPQCRVEIVDGAAHAIDSDQPEALAAVIEDFLG